MTENGRKVISKALKDQKAMDALKKCKTKSEIVKVLNAKGYECSIEDFDGPKAKNCKVSIEEAMAVAGGTTCACVFGGGGDDGETTCVCIAVGGGGPRDDPDLCFCAIGGGSSW